MTITAKTLTLQKIQHGNVAWRLLQTDHAALTVAILDSHLGGQQRRLPVQDLVALVETDLEQLRDANFELPRSAQAYCNDWRDRGFLVRRPQAEARGETFELSPGALNAISFVRQLLQPRRSATSSRLTTIVERIGNLALLTDDDVEKRLGALHAEKARIETEIERLSAGELPILDSHVAIEQIHDIIQLAEEIPDDFAQVRVEFEKLNKNLHETIINYEEGHADILDDIFNGVDIISQSDAGRTFGAFYSIVLDPELSESLSSNIEELLSRDFSKQLDLQKRIFLRRLLRNLQTQSSEVNEVMTSFARSLRRFVQSQEYQQERVIKREIGHALGVGHHLIDTYKPQAETSLCLNLTSTSIKPIGVWQLNNPSDSLATEVVSITESAIPHLSLAELQQLSRQTEIDFTELSTNVNQTLRHIDEPSVATVLHRHPASQGVASVVGLLTLAIEHGRREPDVEHVAWHSDSGIARKAAIDRYTFTHEVRP